MVKEQITVRLKPSIKHSLTKISEDKNHKNVNEYVNKILENHVLNIKEENKLLDITKDIQEDIENIKEVLEKIIEVMAK